MKVHNNDPEKDGPNDPWNDEPTATPNPDNLWVTLANPYMKAVKHPDAAKDAYNKKKPIWVGPKGFKFDVISEDNRNLATLNIWNWYVHNSYIEIPMSQHQALYFDSKPVNMVESGIYETGQMLGSTIGLMGIGGLIGGAFGGPLGAVFGAALLKSIGRKLTKKAINAIFGIFGSIVGNATGFWWNSGGKNSLTDDQVRQLPGFMCILPRDKLELYIQSLFHEKLFGKNHARIPYHHFHMEPQDKLATILGRSEMSFTFSLSDNITYRKYSSDDGSVTDIFNGRTMDIGQEDFSDYYGYIPLVDEYVTVLPGFTGATSDNKDPTD